MKDVESCDILPGAKVTATLSTGVNVTKYQPSFLNSHIKLHDCHQSKAKLFAEKAGYCSVIDEVKLVKIAEANKKDLFMRKHQGKTCFTILTLTILHQLLLQMLRWW